MMQPVRRSKKVASRLLGANEVLISESVVTPEEQSILIGWAQKLRKAGKLVNNPLDAGVYSTPFCSAQGGLTRLTREGGEREEQDQKLVWVPMVNDELLEPFPEAFWRIRSRVVHLLGLQDFREDDYKGSFLSYIAPGGEIHRHRDARLKIGSEEFLILRCNVLFKKADAGGLPVFGDSEVPVPDRGMWAFFATELVHAATEVCGEGFRGLLSFGFLVRPSDLWQRRFRISRTGDLEYLASCSDDTRGALFQELRRSPQMELVGSGRLDLLEFIVRSRADFSLEEAANSLRGDPSEIGEAIYDLQKSNLIESNSSTSFERGRVMVF
jgi:hypothetical protein